MTKETRIIFDMSDLTAVRTECESCRSEVIYKINPTQRSLPEECPWCGSNWREDQTRTQRMFLEMFLSLRTQSSRVVRLRLELDGDAS